MMIAGDLKYRFEFSNTSIKFNNVSGKTHTL